MHHVQLSKILVILINETIGKRMKHVELYLHAPQQKALTLTEKKISAKIKNNRENFFNFKISTHSYIPFCFFLDSYSFINTFQAGV